MAGTVLVTGGTGYIGGEIIDRLLAKNYSVHTTVRNVAKSEPRLRRRWPDAGDRLKIFQADLMADEGWAQANAGCAAVAHVASPFPLGVPRNKDELVIPATQGTLRALRFAHEAGIGRFVQTSSAAAIAYGQKGKDHFHHTDWTQLREGVPPALQALDVLYVVGGLYGNPFALDAVLRLYLHPEQLQHELPALRMLNRTADEIAAQAARVLPAVAAALGDRWRVTVTDCKSQIGSGALPVDSLPSTGLAMTPALKKKGNVGVLASAFRELPVPVVGHIKDGTLILDLRCLDHEGEFVEQLQHLNVGKP